MYSGMYSLRNCAQIDIVHGAASYHRMIRSAPNYTIIVITKPNMHILPLNSLKSITFKATLIHFVVFKDISRFIKHSGCVDQ